MMPPKTNQRRTWDEETQAWGKVQPINPSGISPIEFKCVVFPKPVEEKIGSIHLPPSKVDADKFATMEGTLVAVSPLAFTYVTEDEWQGQKPKIGDRVLFAKYSGLRRQGADGKDYLVTNDKDIVAVLK